MPSIKVRCPHCSLEATEIRPFLFQSAVAYCKKCGWNVERATSKLRSQMWNMWLLSGIGVVLAATAWIKGPYGVNGAALIAIPFVCLPLASGLVTKYRLSRLPAIRPDLRQSVIGEGTTASATEAVSGQEEAASMALRPRMVRLTKRGYLYVAGVGVLTVLVLWLLSTVLPGISGSSNTTIAKFGVATVIYSWALWSCASFFRNRIHERRLLMNGELSQGYVLNQYETRYVRQIAYRYRDASGTGFQNRATDFSNKLYEEMPLHVFYDPFNPSESAALESSLFRIS
jgi:hypothetical protein